MLLFVCFIVIPIVEIGLFITVGDVLGLWPTLFIVILTAFIGSKLIRGQGASALLQVQTSIQSFRDPTVPIANGILIIFAGALLLTPGFLTDFLGISLLIPAVRSFIFSYVAKKVVVHQTASGPKSREFHNDEIIDADYIDIERDQDRFNR